MKNNNECKVLFDGIARMKSYKQVGMHNPLIAQDFCADPFALVYDGRVMVSSSYSSTYSSYYNNYEIWGWSSNNIYASTRARTAVGYLADGKIVLLVIDETGESAGAKLPDVARIMQGLGCVSAMNLDGGGSSAMWVKGKNVVNKWSDTDRPVKATCGFFTR